MTTQFKMTIKGGIVRFWNVFSQTWERRAAADLAPSTSLMSSFSLRDRMRVRKAAGREHKIVVFSRADGVRFSKAFDSRADAAKAYETRVLGTYERIQLVIDGVVQESRGDSFIQSVNRHPSYAVG